MGEDVPDLDTIRERIQRASPARIEADRRAAVAAVLRETSEPEILLIRRAEHPDDPWSGHMAFPGGRHDPDDEDLLHTAARETREEVGLDLGEATLLGRLDDVEAVSRARRTGMVITPFVFGIEGEPALRPNYEVAEILWAPLGPMMRGEVDTVRPYDHMGVVWKLPAYDVHGNIVWGLTYQMLQRLFSTLERA